MSASSNYPEWKILLVLVPIALLEVFQLAPALVPAHAVAHKELFLEYASRICRPEPLKTARYLLLIGSLPLLSLAWLKLQLNAKVQATSPVLAAVLEVIAQIAVLSFVLLALASANPFFDPVCQERYWYTALVVAVLCIAGSLYSRQLGWLTNRTAGFILPLIAFVLLAVNLSTDVFTWQALTHAAGDVRGHLPATMGEFAAALNGRTMLVDYFPLYQNLSEYVLQPVFQVVGLNPGTFTAVMALISAAGFALVYLVFLQLTQKTQAAALLFIPIVIMSFITFSSGVERANEFNYFANGPLRFFGPWLVLYATAHYFSKPSKWKVVACSFIGTMVALNNLDFGLPALLASAAAILFVDREGNWCTGKYFLRTLGCGMLGLAAAVALTVIVVFARSGGIPDFEKLIEYQRFFVVQGFFSVPLPDGLFYWLPLITWLTAIVVGLRKLLSKREDKQALLIALLLFSGIYGCGTAMYFLGRSRWENLIALFPSWGICLMILLWSYMPEIVASWKTWDGRKRMQAAVPFLLGIIAYSFCWSHLVDTPDPLAQWNRLRMPATSSELPFALLAQLKEKTRPGEQVMICYPYGHWFAVQSGVSNYFPFQWRFAMNLKSQLELTLDIVRARRITKVFGCLPVEMKDALIEMGFVKVGQLNPGAADNQDAFDNLHSPFEYWQQVTPAMGRPQDSAVKLDMLKAPMK